jgi:hypothetical protein
MPEAGCNGISNQFAGFKITTVALLGDTVMTGWKTVYWLIRVCLSVCLSVCLNGTSTELPKEFI